MGSWNPGPGPTDGDDTFVDDGTDTVVDGGLGNDTFRVGAVLADRTLDIYGDAGDDELRLGVFEFYIDSTLRFFGGEGSDTVYSVYVIGSGSIELDMGAGDDLVRVWGVPDGGLTVTLGEGTDTIDVWRLGAPITIVDFEAGENGDVLQTIEILQQQVLNNAVNGNPFDNGDLLLVEQGDDVHLETRNSLTIAVFENVSFRDFTAYNFDGYNPFGSNSGTIEDDTIIGTDSEDLIYGFEGNDTIDGGLGSDRLFGGEGSDLLNGQDGFDQLFGGDGNDVINGGDQDDRIEGGNGNDVLSGGRQNDTIDGGAGDDVILGELGVDILYGGTGDDLVLGGNRDDQLFGEDGDDRTFGGNGNDVIDGGAGVDILRGGSQDDRLNGGADNDVAFGGTGRDDIAGGDGNDLLFGRGGFDVLNGGAGDDTLEGGIQADQFIFEGAFGNDTITDFAATNNAERINLSAVNAISDFQDLIDNHMSQVDANVVIDDGVGKHYHPVRRDALRSRRHRLCVLTQTIRVYRLLSASKSIVGVVPTIGSGQFGRSHSRTLGCLSCELQFSQACI